VACDILPAGNLQGRRFRSFSLAPLYEQSVAPILMGSGNFLVRQLPINSENKLMMKFMGLHGG
jgi:hypothetical protein